MYTKLCSMLKEWDFPTLSMVWNASTKFFSWVIWLDLSLKYDILSDCKFIELRFFPEESNYSIKSQKRRLCAQILCRGPTNNIRHHSDIGLLFGCRWATPKSKSSLTWCRRASLRVNGQYKFKLNPSSSRGVLIRCPWGLLDIGAGVLS